MRYVFANNATSRLAGNTSAASATIQVNSGDGAKFPSPVTANSEVFSVTVEDRRSGQFEICICTGRSGDVLQVMRGQEGTTAQDFVIGATVSNRLSAGAMTDIYALHTVTPNPIDGLPYIRRDANWVNPVKADVGLGSVDNTTDANKPVSGPQKTYIDAGDANNASQIAAANTNANNRVLKAGDTMTGHLSLPTAPAAANAVRKDYVDTGLATKIGDAPSDGQQYARQNAAWTVVVSTGGGGGIAEAPTDGQLYSRQGSTGSWQVSPGGGGGGITDAPNDGALYGRQSLGWQKGVKAAGDTMTGHLSLPVGPAAANAVRKDYVDVADATLQTNINAKEPTIASGLVTQYWRGDKSWQLLDKASVGLGNVDNTSDASKPISTATATALAGKEPTISAGTTAQYWRGDKTWVTLPAAGIAEAPNDGQQYARQSLAWAVVAGGAAGREKLTAARTYYVATTGVDTNDGLTVGAPFLTIQKAWDVVAQTLDLNGFVITIQVADGTYAGTISTANKPIVGGDDAFSVWIKGNIGNVDAVTITGAVIVSWGGLLTLNAVNLSPASGTALTVQGSGKCETQSPFKINGAAGVVALAADGKESYLNIGTTTLVGPLSTGVIAQNGAYVRLNSTVTATATLAFSNAFIQALTGSTIQIVATPAGTATGKRYDVATGGRIIGSGLTASSIPGSVAGTVDANGSYYGTWPASGREMLLAARTYYVRTDGSDSNTGTTNNAGGAFLTLLKAFQAIAGLDVNGFAVSVTIADGTYAGACLVAAGPEGCQTNLTTLFSAIATAGAVFVSGTANAIITGAVTINAPMSVMFSGIQFKSPGSLSLSNPAAQGLINNLSWDNANCVVNSGARLRVLGTHTYISSTTFPFNISGSYVSFYSPTFTTAVAFSCTAFLTANYGSKIWCESAGSTISGAGSFSGTRYNMVNGSVVDLNTFTETFFPGSITGLVDANGSRYGGKASSAIVQSDSAPSSPVNGQLWFDSTTGNLYIYYNDGNSSQWVQVGGA